jgi:hypothetical protein
MSSPQLNQTRSLAIEGKPSEGLFIIICAKCGNPTENEYLGYDPWVPRFRATCSKCGEYSDWTLSMWNGLPVTSST